MPKAVAKSDPKATRDRGGRPAVISRAKVLEAARKLPANELIMSAIAQRLGVKKASLYYHFRSKQELSAALGSSLVRDWPIQPSDPEHWRRWLERAVTGLFDTLCSHPVFREVENLSQFARAALPLVEHAMEILQQAGFEPAEAQRIG